MASLHFRLAVKSALVTLPLSLVAACHISRVDLDASVAPSVRPTTELGYLISQYQLPRNLRSNEADTEIVRQTVDSAGRIRTVKTASPSSSTASVSESSHHAPPTATTSDPDTVATTSEDTANPLVNPTQCENTIAVDPFTKRTKATESWPVNGTLYSSTVTSVPLSLASISSTRKACTHIQVHNRDSIQTIDRTYSKVTINNHAVFAQHSVTVTSSTDNSNSTSNMVFSLAYIVTMSKVSIQVTANQNHPFTRSDTEKLQTLLSRQIGNIPD